MEMILDVHDDFVTFIEEVAKDLGVDIKTATEWLLGYIGAAENVDPWVERLRPITRVGV